MTLELQVCLTHKSGEEDGRSIVRVAAAVAQPFGPLIVAPQQKLKPLHYLVQEPKNLPGVHRGLYDWKPLNRFA
jgi:hypothetical protein